MSYFSLGQKDTQPITSILKPDLNPALGRSGITEFQELIRHGIEHHIGPEGYLKSHLHPQNQPRSCSEKIWDPGILGTYLPRYRSSHKLRGMSKNHFHSHNWLRAYSEKSFFPSFPDSHVFRLRQE